jgi:hypothetical protein
MSVTRTTPRVMVRDPQQVARTALAVDKKKQQDASNTRTRNVAIGVITVLAIATAAYLGRGYFAGVKPTCITTDPKVAKKVCLDQFTADFRETNGVQAQVDSQFYSPDCQAKFNKALDDYTNTPGPVGGLNACVAKLLCPQP